MSDTTTYIDAVPQPEWVYVTIPADWICTYHKILSALADYGQKMLDDCKVRCADRSKNVVDCFNMFNAAVAARKLGKTKLANTLYKYVDAQLLMIYGEQYPEFIFPLDENGQIKACVSCGERPVFRIDPNTMELYQHKFDNGFDEHMHLAYEDGFDWDDTPEPGEIGDALWIKLVPSYHEYPTTGGETEIRPCADIWIYYNKEVADYEFLSYTYYFDDAEVTRFDTVTNLSEGNHKFQVVINYDKDGTHITKIVTEYLNYTEQ